MAFAVRTALTRLRVGHRRVLLALALVLVRRPGFTALIGTEFMPKLDEGSIVITSRKFRGSS